MGSDNRKEYPNIIVFDLETGGFSPQKHPLIEFAAIAINNNLEEVGRCEWVVLPYSDEKEYTPGAFKANGFTMGEIHKRGIDSSIVMKELVAFLESMKVAPRTGITMVPDSKPVMCGHNIDAFDLPFLTQFFKDHKYDLDKFISTKATIDTMKEAQKFFGHSGYPFKNHQLGTCCKYIGHPLVDAHRAMNDVEGNLKLVKYFLESVRGTGKPREVETEDRYRENFKLS